MDKMEIERILLQSDKLEALEITRGFRVDGLLTRIAKGLGRLSAGPPFGPSRVNSLVRDLRTKQEENIFKEGYREKEAYILQRLNELELDEVESSWFYSEHTGITTPFEDRLTTPGQDRLFTPFEDRNRMDLSTNPLIRWIVDCCSR